LGGWLLGFTDGKPKPPFPWAGWLAIPFFGSCAVILALRLFDREPQIIIDSDGVFSKHWSSSKVPWSEIATIAPATVSRQQFLCCFLVRPERYPAESLLGRAMRSNRALGFGDLALSVTGTNRQFHELVAAVDAFRPGMLAAPTD